MMDADRQNRADKAIAAYTKHREDHTFRHYNHALGKFIEGKAHYIAEMKRGGYIPTELAEEWAQEYDKKHPPKEYKLSTKAEEIIKSLKLTADKKGNIKLGGRAIQALKEIGAIPSDKEAVHRLDVAKEVGLL